MNTTTHGNPEPVSGAALEAEFRAHIGAGRHAQAEALIRPYLASGSGPIVLWQWLVEAIRAQGKIAETRMIQEMIVDTTPGDLTQRFNLAETLLLQGDFANGWREYRHRYGMQHTFEIGRRVQMPRWDGRPIPGRTLLIHDEQGFGDTFQFMRMVAWARERSGARVVFEVNPQTLGLASRMAGYDVLTERGTIPPAFDFHCELMDLPFVMGLRLDALPGGPMPYLSADAQRLQTWREKLAHLPRPLVALVWAGRPTHVNDARWSMHLDQLAPLGASGASFIAIQKGPASVQAMTPPPGMRVVSLSDAIADFEDTAAILQLADLLISVDSSPVHLAGALGRPAWVMLPMVPDWRWLLDRADTPWYPSVSLFRQASYNDWSTVVADMAAALQVYTPPGG